MSRLVIGYALLKGLLIALSGRPIPSHRSGVWVAYEGEEARRAMRRVETNRAWWLAECRSGRRPWAEYPYAY